MCKWQRIYRWWMGGGLALVLGLASVRPVLAAAPGMHVLHPTELTTVAQQFAPARSHADQPIYVTIPFTLDDTKRLPEWQAAWRVARDKNVVPIVRLATRFVPADQSWQIPTRKDMVDLITALGQLEWPQAERLVIIGNEPNHAQEWGGQLDPAGFAEVSAFAADWLATEPYHYVVLPAAMDLAATNTKDTREALSYWRAALAARPDLLSKFSAWNSHSYPNPGFLAAPQRTTQNSLRGYQHELAFLRQYSDKSWPVYITETGWLGAALRAAQLRDYYAYAWRHIWSDPQIQAVTPFVFTGDPGPFAGFSFFSAAGQPTAQWQAFITAWQGQALANRPAGPVLQ